MNKVHVKTGDTVVILSGKDKGKKGKVLEVSPKEGKVIVEGLNIATKHVKPRRQGEQGGIVEAEAAMYASKVQAVCPKCGKPTRVAHKFLEDGTKVRVCKNADCGYENADANLEVWPKCGSHHIDKLQRITGCLADAWRQRCPGALNT